MDAWIGEIAVLALERGDGVAESAWDREVYRDFPAELRALYSEMDGVTLPGEVRLLPLAELSGPPQGERVWHFGRKGAHEHLFALRKADALEAVRESPRWLESLPNDAWVYGVKAGAVGPVRLHRTLARLLEVLVPPRQTEDFGEHTFARAFALVERALGTIEESVTSGKATSATGAAPKRKKAPARKPTPKRAPRGRARPEKKRTAPARKKTSPARAKKVVAKSAKPVASGSRKPAKAKPAPARKKASATRASKIKGAGTKRRGAALARKPAARARSKARRSRS